MKSMKKFAGLLLALALVLCLAVPAFAASPVTGSITIDNAKEGETYTAYKIFDVVYSGNNYAYSIIGETSNKWWATVKAFADVDTNGLKLTPTAADPTMYVVETTSGFSAASFAAALAEGLKINGASGTALVYDNGAATATGLDLGYYFVTTTTGALCNLTTTNPAATIHDKNDVPFEKTADDKSVEVGQVVTYTITGKVPDTTGFGSYQYVVKDKMSAGLTFTEDSVTVYVGGVELTSNYTVSYSENDCDFALTINVMNLQSQVTNEIKVTYTATVNEAAVSVISENNATLTYSNDPTKETTTTTQPKVVPVYTAKIIIDKYETGEENVKLAGAKFVLYKNTDGGSKKFYKYDEQNDVVSWVDVIADATEVTTDNNGAADFIGLEDGTYYLHETEAPAGYNKLTADREVVIDGSAATKDNLTSLTATAKIANSTGSLLPATGGMGTTLFYTVGAVLVLAAVVLLVTKKRVNTAN